jgi:hypothetical protein
MQSLVPLVLLVDFHNYTCCHPPMMMVAVHR